jgi:TM2 domain-containing membrane protein YozV
MRYTMIGADGARYGPVDIAQLLEWARQGRIIERTEILDHQTGRRFLANDLAELHAFFEQSTAFADCGDPPQMVAPVLPPAVLPPPGQPFIPSYYSVSPRNRVVAGVLALFFGPLGVHRFYLGYTGVGALQLAMSTVLFPFTCGMSLVFVAIWTFIEAILCFMGGMRDAEGRMLS